CCLEAEGRADVLSREGAEPRTAEVAVVAGCFGLFAHECPMLCVDGPIRAAIIGPSGVGGKRCPRRKLTNFRQIRARRTGPLSALLGEGCQHAQRLGKTL